MTYLLDTNACIRFLNGRSISIRDRLLSTAPTDIVLCSVVVGELLYGAERSNTPGRTREKQLRFIEKFVSAPFDDRAAHEYAKVRAQLASAGQMIGANDLLIASIAIVNSYTLVTNNISEFGRIADLKIENWETIV